MRDIGPLEGAGFRWTGGSPAVNLTLPATGDVRLRAHFWLADQAFAQTGPVEASYWVNDLFVAKQRYEHPGEQNFDEAVDAKLLRAGANQARMELDKTFLMDGVRRGVALVEFGFAD